MSDLYYMNARARAWRGRLLSRSDYETILALPDLPALMTRLLDSSYGRSIESVGAAASDASRVEEGLRRNFSETLAELFAVSSGDPREVILALLGYWEVYNLKTVLRGKTAGLPPEKILSALIPTGSQDEAVLEELGRQPDLRAVVDLLVSWRDPYGRVLLGALKDYREPKDLFLLETALDRSYFERSFATIERSRLPASDREALTGFFRFLADRTNLMTVLKAVEEQLALVNRERYFVPGGKVLTKPSFIRLLSARSLPEALTEAGRLFSEPALRTLGEAGRGVPPLSSVERQLDRMLLRRVRFRMRVDPLGIGGIVGFLLDKIREITNLRMILRGRIVNLPDPELSQLLIVEY